MTEVQPINICDNNATYSAVKIRVNNPKTIINDNCAPNIKAVDIEVNNPQAIYDKNFYYQYPQANNPVMYDNLYPNQQIIPNLPVLPVAYQTNIIQNGTDNTKEINSEKQKEIKAAQAIAQNIIDSLDAIRNAQLNANNNPSFSVVNPAMTENTQSQAEGTRVVVPEPNVTTVEEGQLKKPDFAVADNNSETNSQKEVDTDVNTKADEVKKPVKDVEIIPSQDILPEIDIPQVVKNLRSEDYDTVAAQMKEIEKAYMTNPEKVIPYITVDVFDALIDIANADTTELEKPDNKQIEIRRQIIENKIAENIAIKENKNASEIELPHKISDEDYQYAIRITPAERAERNKRTALNTITILAREYSDEIKKETGSVIPMTDLPGMSVLVDTLRYSDNDGTKIVALANLEYLYRPEYQKDYKSLLEIVANDNDRNVAQYASEMLQELNKVVPNNQETVG